MICLEAVRPAVAHEDAFLVFLVDDLVVFAPCAGIGIQGVGATLVERGVPGEGQFT